MDITWYIFFMFLTVVLILVVEFLPWLRGYFSNATSYTENPYNYRYDSYKDYNMWLAGAKYRRRNK